MNEKIRLRYICTIETGDHDTQDAEKDGIYPFYVRSPIIEKSNTQKNRALIYMKQQSA